MNLRPALHLALACAVLFATTGCNSAPGKPSVAAEAETQRPEQLLDPATLYKQNCAACHGDQGRNGASISLANPTYLAIAGVANLQRITAAGVPGTLMPGFSKAAGGMLTDEQIAALAQGIVHAWGQPLAPGTPPPAYAATTPGDPAQGQKTFATFCARCHGADGAGNPPHTGSLVDPAYLALVSDQSLRSAILAGRPENHMPDWRGYGPTPLTDRQITDTVAWLASHRIATPGQPYRQHP